VQREFVRRLGSPTLSQTPVILHAFSRPAPIVRGVMLVTAFSCTARTPASGQPANAHPRTAAEYPSILSFRTERIADGVYAFITPEERSSFQAGNSIAIVGDDGVLVFDTGNIPSMTRRQIAEIRRITNNPVRFVVNSHWHPDHTLGNAIYRAAFPGVTIIGTSATRDGIRDRVPTYVDQMKSFAPIDSVMRLRLATGRMRDGTPMPDAVRLTWGLTTRDYAEFMPEVVRTTPSAPDRIVDDSLTIMLGRRRVQIVSPGRGNTAGDAFVFLPDERVLLTGDLVTVPCPFPGTAYFADWVHSLDALLARRPAVIVPGHGDVQHDDAYVRLVRELVAFTLDRARDAVQRGIPVDSLQRQIDFAPFVKRFAGDDPVRIAAFENFYAQPAMPRAYEEAKAAPARSSSASPPPWQRGLQRGLHPPHVRPAPVRAPARRASPHRPRQIARAGRHLRDDLRRRHRHQRRVVEQTARHQLLRPRQRERAHHFAELHERDLRSDGELAVRTQLAQQMPVPREQHAPVVARPGDECDVRRVGR